MGLSLLKSQNVGQDLRFDMLRVFIERAEEGEELVGGEEITSLGV